MNYTEQPMLGGLRREYDFPNGYGASVVCHKGSYGGKDGLWELAVLKHGKIIYDTPVTSDVIGYLREDELPGILAQIEALVDVAVTRYCTDQPK